MLNPKILVNATSGIGMNILYVPMLRVLKKWFPASKVTLAVRFEASRQLLANSPYIDEILVLNQDTYGSAAKIFQLLVLLRKKQFDICLNTFPANKAIKNFLAYLSGAKCRISHNYPCHPIKSLSFLINCKVEIDKQAHDVEQNLNLLKSLGCTWNLAEENLELWLTKEDEDEAKEYLRVQGLNEKLLVGLHPGSSTEFGMQIKRWEKQKFAKLAKELIRKYSVYILLFGGEEEDKLKEDIFALLSEKKAHIVRGLNIRQTAALMKNCRLFISNDSGLMHLAAAVGLKTIAIFGPTD